MRLVPTLFLAAACRTDPVTDYGTSSTTPSPPETDSAVLSTPTTDSATSDTADTASTATFTGPPSITLVSADCAGDVISYRIETAGLTADGFLWSIESGDAQPWDEEHDVRSFAFDSNGAWDHLAADVQAADGLQTALIYQRNVQSQFTCEALDDPTVMTFAFAVIDPATGAVADCAVAGQDPAGVIAGDYAPYVTGPSFDLSTCHPTTLE